MYRFGWESVYDFTKPSVNRCNLMPNFSKTNKEALVIKTSFCFYSEEFQENIDDVFGPSIMYIYSVALQHLEKTL